MGQVENAPRRGSMQIWPRKRAKRMVARVRTFYGNPKETKPLAFLGYKAGMSHAQVRDNNPNSTSKSQIISIPVTIIECPPIKPYSIRFYKRSNSLGLQVTSEIYSEKLDKQFKNKNSGNIPETFDDVRIVMYTDPRKTGLSRKNPDIFEMSMSGKDAKEKLAKGQELLKKDFIYISEIFNEGQLLDVHAVSKGKGMQGSVKRFGVKIRQHKSEKTKRGPGTLGPWTPKRVMAGRIPHAGKMGYHQRTEYNKLLVKIVKPEDVNQKGGIKHYGNVLNEAVLIKGSVPGPAKRPIILTAPQRPHKKPEVYELVKVSTESKQ